LNQRGRGETTWTRACGEVGWFGISAVVPQETSSREAQIRLTRNTIILNMCGNIQNDFGKIKQ
jgi:hypothetical protein